MEGRVLCLENDPKSIEPEVEVISEYGLEPKILARPRALGNYLEDTKSVDPKSVKAIVLDMHMPNIKNLAEIRLPSADTLGGEAVGLAVAERYLRTPKSPFKKTPLAFLTGFSIDAPVLNRIKALQRDDNNVKIIRKTTDISLFRKFIRSVIDPVEEESENKSVQVLSDYKEGIDIAIRIMDELGIRENDQIALLGYEQSKETKLSKVAQKAKGTMSVDIKDRVDYIIDIKSSLDAIFGLNQGKQRKWLGTRQDVLNGKSPIEVLRSGHQHDLVHIAALLRHVTG